MSVDDVDDSEMFKQTEVSNSSTCTVHFITLISAILGHVFCYCLVQEAMIVLGFNEDERKSLFRTVASVLHFGNIQVKQRPREEWATIPTTTEAEKVTNNTSLTHT